jgi:hypothetical protein
MPPEVDEFDHFRSADDLMKDRQPIFASLPDLDEAFDRFENIFKQLNCDAAC